MEFTSFLKLLDSQKSKHFSSFRRKAFLKSTPKKRGYMLDEQGIINEVFRETGIHIDSIFEMKIEELKSDEEVPDNCPRCNQELTLIYDRSEYDENNPFSLLVLKCQRCHIAYSYWWEEFCDPTYDDNSGYILSKKGKLIISKKAAAEYLKEISTREKRNKELIRLFQEKLPILCKAGLSLETLNLARNQAAAYIQQHKTSKKGISKLLAAAIYSKANGEYVCGSWKHTGEGISEEDLAEIFGVTRKTIRKWKKVFETQYF
ncbi:MAG: hypothetical protein NWE99_03750 [Candidatus Bathyarchaeota archaeon]|nr:hypothetical protein [Candidatus Bathyarchaeota archaeon]